MLYYQNCWDFAWYIVSLHFGACGAKFSTYLTAGISGSLLSIVITALIVTKFSNPFSIEFIMVLLLRILVSAGTDRVTLLLPYLLGSAMVLVGTLMLVSYFKEKCFLKSRQTN